MITKSIITPIAVKTATALKVTPPVHQLPEISLKPSQSLGDKKITTPELITRVSQGVIPFGGSFGYSESKDEPW